MSEWKDYKIEDIAKNMADSPFGTNLKTQDYTEDGIIVVQGKNIQGRKCDWTDNRFVSPEKYNSLSRHHANLGSLVFPKVGTIGKVGILTQYKNQKAYLLSTNTMMLETNSKIANQDYVYYYFSSNKIRNLIQTSNSNSVQPVFNFTSLKNFPISLPSLPTQTAIASILSSLDDKIELNNKINKNLEDLAQVLFKQWFVDFEFPNENGEPYKSSGGEMVESELGEIPKGWYLTKIKDLNPILETGRRPKGGVKGIDEGMPSIGAESIKGIGYFDFSKTKYVSFDYAELMNRGIIKGYELLIYKDGGKPGTFIPHFSMFGNGFPFEKMVINEHVFSLNFNNNLNFNVFCYFFFNTPYVVSMLENSGGKAAIPGINQSDINNLLVFQPENDFVKLFGEIAYSNVSTILQNCKESHILSKLRDTLLPKLISGELEVSEALLETEKAM